MKESNFLNNLRKEDKLQLVEPSEDICSSYLEKADNCLKSAKLLLPNNLYENSISMAYYTMYNSLTALLFKAGIKCENHSGSIILFKNLFNKLDLFKIISFAKKERIDKQYYVTTEKSEITKDSAEELVLKSEDFIVKMKLIIKNLTNEEIDNIRKDFEVLVG